MRAKTNICVILLLFNVLLARCSYLNQIDSIHIVCNESNDLIRLLENDNHSCSRYDDIEYALEQVPNNGTLLVLARNYPYSKTLLPEDFYQNAKVKNLKVYVEFPEGLPSGPTGKIKSTKKERLVTTSDFFGEALPSMSILDAGLYSYIDAPERECHIKGGNVAGFKKAVYGLTNTPTAPILFKEDNVLISTTKLSDFNKSRYSPKSSWVHAITGILTYLDVELRNGIANWEPIVRPAFSKDEPLTDDAYQNAVKQGAAWYEMGRFLIHPMWRAHWRGIDSLPLPVGPPMDLDFPSGNGSLGVMEGHYSYINPDGSQPYRYWLRADCVSETAMTLAMAHSVDETAHQIELSKNLMDFLFNSAVFQTTESTNPEKSSYGLIGWADTHPRRYYGDDNARVILGAILTAQILGDGKWDDQIERLVLANFRTAGEKGFRGGSLTGEKIEKQGWKKLMGSQLENPAPHYESWLWATYL